MSAPEYVAPPQLSTMVLPGGRWIFVLSGVDRPAAPVEGPLFGSMGMLVLRDVVTTVDSTDADPADVTGEPLLRPEPQPDVDDEVVPLVAGVVRPFRDDDLCPPPGTRVRSPRGAEWVVLDDGASLQLVVTVFGDPIADGAIDPWHAVVGTRELRVA